MAGGLGLEDYGAFVVGRGSSATLGLLGSEGRYVAPLPSASFLHLVNGDVDVRTLSVALGSPWAADARGEAVGLVHFYAPIKASWMTAIESRGLQPVLYVPTDAFVVRGPSSALSGLASLPYVDWSGPYDPAWKIAPQLASVSGIPDVRIVVFPGEPANAVAAWLARQGVPAHPSSSSGSAIIGAFGTGDFAWVRARVPASLLEALAALPEVQYIDPVARMTVGNYATDWVLQTNVTGSFRYWNANLNGT